MRQQRQQLTTAERLFVGRLLAGAPPEAPPAGEPHLVPVRSWIFRALVTGSRLPGFATPARGLRRLVARRLEVVGDLDLSDIDNDGDRLLLDFEDCVFHGKLSLRNSDLLRVSLAGSSFLALDGRGMRCAGDVNLERCRSSLPPPSDVAEAGLGACRVRLDRATIGGRLIASDAAFALSPSEPTSAADPKPAALSLVGAQIAEDVNLTRAVVTGGVAASRAKLGSFWAGGAHFIRRDTEALDLEGAHVSGSVSLGHFHTPGLAIIPTRCDGRVSFYGATIDGELYLSAAQFKAPPDQPATRRDIAHAELDQVAGSRFRIESTVENREMAGPAEHLQLLADRPDVLRFKRRLRANQAPGVPRFSRRSE